VRLIVLPEAELELTNAVFWYDDRRLGLGDEFTLEFERVRDRICDAPQQWARIGFYDGRHDVRRCFMHRFPYGVVFARRADEVIVVAVAHMRRPPLYWLERLS
jgi:hypothetical protein